MEAPMERQLAHVDVDSVRRPHDSLVGRSVRGIAAGRHCGIAYRLEVAWSPAESRWNQRAEDEPDLSKLNLE
jgi:hypothetical protein